MWDGYLKCVLRRGKEPIPFGARYHPGDLGFDLQLIDADAEIDESMLANYDIIFCPADARDTLHIARLGVKVGVKVVYSIEYVLKTRLQIVGFSGKSGFARRAYGMLWHLRQEIRRRRAFRLATAIQANGYPAAASYGRLNPKTMMYLDNRMRPALFANEMEMRSRSERLFSGAPLRLIHSGRLEPMRPQDLVPFACFLRAPRRRLHPRHLRRRQLARGNRPGESKGKASHRSRFTRRLISRPCWYRGTGARPTFSSAATDSRIHPAPISKAWGADWQLLAMTTRCGRH
ncbi:hypothetical protein LHFGNBLO_001670 [Mesorhizobium sp. AR10]|uniref:hypothetical protein n=1 Tax=Mesorhizobium sp. AR10 TaxID=2865839 RepID=UPI00215F2733|nr:hypothetical protein [Mesorhizobium sp. AR10]UVK40230.1 hypothetical protein LHFGNBLO_001670 [Mesorhizobium sp. AR10]